MIWSFPLQYGGLDPDHENLNFVHRNFCTLQVRYNWNDEQGYKIRPKL